MSNGIFSYIRNNSSSFPLIIGIILFVAFIAMFVVVVVTLITIKRDRKSVQNFPELPPSAMLPIENANIPVQVSKMGGVRNNPIIWWLGECINRFLLARNWIQADKITKSFFKATEYLKKSLGIRDRYSLPWFVVLGATNSGQSSLLRGFTHDDFTEDDTDPLSWWFLKNGVVIDVKGDVFMPETSVDNWSTVLHLLYRYRGKRPINGLILTISATELYGKKKISMEEIKHRAGYISRKLAYTQHYLGLRLPIYIVVTKTDIIPGFQSFCSELPIRNRNNMLGWSSPFTIDTVYNSNILNMAFEELANELNTIRLEIFSENLTQATKDGVFVFPSELLSIQERLSCYINTIFEASANSEGSYFRGFYFTGDSKMIPIDGLSMLSGKPGDNAMAVIGTPDANINEAGNISASFKDENSVPKKIFFFEDLLLKKIFAEANIATPIHAKMHKAHKAIFIAKIATVAFVIIGSYGLFNAKDNLNNNKNNIYPTLCKLSFILQNSNNLDINTLDSRGNEILANYSNQLLSLMQQLNSVGLYSCFVPASWFSSIGRKLQTTFINSYQRVVIRTIYINLLLKIKHMLYMQVPNNKPTLDETLNPTTSILYKKLNNYITDLIELEKFVNKFDGLRVSGNPNDLNDLIEYTFKGNLQPQFLGNYKDFRLILLDTRYPSLDLSPHKQTIYNTVYALFNNFINTIFNSKDNFIVRIDTFIKQLSRQTIREYPKCDEIRKFANELTKACKNLGNEGETWLDHFSPEKIYKELFDNVTLLFGKETVEHMLGIFNYNYNFIKEQLLNLNKKLEANTSVNNQDNESRPITAPVLMFGKIINNWVSSSFMSVPLNYELITDIPKEKIIYWDDELIKYATIVSQDFDDFIVTKLAEFPKIMQEGINLISRTNLYAVISGIVGKAQSFVDAPIGLTKQLTSEETLQRQVGELKTVAPKFQKLLSVLREEQPNFVFTNLRTVLNKIGFDLLKHVDNLLDDQQPYKPISLDFGTWDGKAGAGFHAYAVSDTEDLKAYVRLQRSLITRLVIEFAKPIVDFLNSEYVYDKNYGHHSQLYRWVRIVDSAESFNKKDPHNSISNLEKFILNTLNSYTIDNIADKITIEELKVDTGDYFTEIARTIKKTLYKKAEVLLRQRSINRYERLRNYYTRYLERFYPFKIFNTKQRIERDVDLDTVREFFKLYNECGGSPEAILEKIYQLDDGKQAYNFLKKVQSIKDMLGDNIVNNFEVVKVKMDMNFNVNKRNEKNTEYLIDRVFHPNHDANIEAINPYKHGTWFFGEPVSIDFRYAENDNEAPRPDFDEGDPDYSVDANLARFECTGNWSLLRFLQKYRVSGLNSTLSDANQTVLSFKIPLNDNRSTQVYVGLTLYKPQSSESEPLVSIKIPSVPGDMPKLPQSIINLRNTPILADKALSGKSEFAVPKVYRNAEDKKPTTSKTTQKASNTKSKVLLRDKLRTQTVQQANATQQEDISARFIKKPKEEEILIEEPISQQVNDILNSDEVPVLPENDTLITVSEQPIG